MKSDRIESESDPDQPNYSTTRFLRCESSFTSTLSSDTQCGASKMIRSFSEDDVRIYPGKGSAPKATSGIRADYIPYQASHSNNASYIDGKRPPSKNTAGSVAASPRHSRGQRTNTIVVVPSIDFDAAELKRTETAVEFYEERQLYHLLLLIRDPTFRIIYVTSNQVNQGTIRYYLSLDGCGDVELGERLSRLFLLSPENNDDQCHSLSAKLLKSDKLLHTIGRIVENVSVGDCPTAGLSFFCGSDAGDEIAHRLNLRPVECSGRNLYFGSKQGRYVVPIWTVG